MNEEQAIGKFITECYAKDYISEADIDDILNFIPGYCTRSNIWDWFLYYFSDKFCKGFNDLHRYLWDVCQIGTSATLASRGHGKSTIMCVGIPLYLSLHSKRFNYFLNVQSTATKAKQINLAIRNEFETNEKLIRDYGYMIDSKKDTESLFVLKNGVIFGCCSMGGSIRGLQYNNIRPSFIILDDPYESDDIGNYESILKKNSWVRSSLIPAANIDNYCLNIIGTAISKNDIMHEFQKLENVRTGTFRAVDENGKSLWMTDEQIKEAKSLMGSILWEREYQQNILDDSSAIIRQAWIHYYDDLPKEMEETVITVDPAISTKDSADFTGKAVIAKDKNSNYFVIDIFQDKFSFNQNIEHIKELNAKYNPRSVKIESVAAFQAFGQELRRTTRVPVRDIIVQKDKDTRLINVSSLFENGKVFFSSKIKQELMQTLIGQLCNRKPDHDDIRDAIVVGLELQKSNIMHAV